MFDLSNLGKILITIGILIAAIGLGLVMMGEIHWFGKLPGDFFWRGKNVSFYFPISTSVLISILLTIVLWLISRH
jgi:ribose/xylose/arabinose/galactoside ABC-type transport system permease subunit